MVIFNVVAYVMNYNDLLLRHYKNSLNYSLEVSKETNVCMWCICTGTVNKAGDTPFSLAYKGGHWEVVKYLAQEHQCDPKCVYTANC